MLWCRRQDLLASQVGLAQQERWMSVQGVSDPEPTAGGVESKRKARKRHRRQFTKVALFWAAIGSGIGGWVFVWSTLTEKPPGKTEPGPPIDLHKPESDSEPGSKDPNPHQTSPDRPSRDGEPQLVHPTEIDSLPNPVQKKLRPEKVVLHEKEAKAFGELTLSLVLQGYGEINTSEQPELAVTVPGHDEIRMAEGSSRNIEGLRATYVVRFPRTSRSERSAEIWIEEQPKGGDS